MFDSLREMKALIEREVARRELDQHLKPGAAAIAGEIEFLVQSMQLVRGGSDRRAADALSRLQAAAAGGLESDSRR